MRGDQRLGFVLQEQGAFEVVPGELMGTRTDDDLRRVIAPIPRLLAQLVSVRSVSTRLVCTEYHTNRSMILFVNRSQRSIWCTCRIVEATQLDHD